MSELSINQKINLRGLAEEFPKIQRREFLDRLKKLKIGKTGQLASSIYISGKIVGNFSIEIRMTYAYYGIYTHHGVGKGITKDDKTIVRLIGSGRKSKPWLKGAKHMEMRLMELYMEVSGRDMAQNLLDSIEGTKKGKPIVLFKKGY